MKKLKKSHEGRTKPEFKITGAILPVEQSCEKSENIHN